MIYFIPLTELLNIKQNSLTKTVYLNNRKNNRDIGFKIIAKCLDRAGFIGESEEDFNVKDIGNSWGIKEICIKNSGN